MVDWAAQQITQCQHQLQAGDSRAFPGLHRRTHACPSRTHTWTAAGMVRTQTRDPHYTHATSAHECVGAYQDGRQSGGQGQLCSPRCGHAVGQARTGHLLHHCILAVHVQRTVHTLQTSRVHDGFLQHTRARAHVIREPVSYNNQLRSPFKLRKYPPPSSRLPPTGHRIPFHSYVRCIAYKQNPDNTHCNARLAPAGTRHLMCASLRARGHSCVPRCVRISLIAGAYLATLGARDVHQGTARCGLHSGIPGKQVHRLECAGDGRERTWRESTR